MNGDVSFFWNGSSSQAYQVLIGRGATNYTWYSVTGVEYTVKDAVLYDSISITVRVPPKVETNTSFKYKGIFSFVDFCSIYGAP